MTSGLGKFSFKKFYTSLYIVVNVLKFFTIFKPNIVYIAISPHGLAFYKDAFITLLLKLFGAKLVFHLHGKGILDETKPKLKKAIYRFVFKGVDIIHLSATLFEDVSGIRDQNTKIFSLSNGVPDEYCKKVVKNEVTTFIYLSNFIPSKGAHELINAINLLDESYRGRFLLKLVGAFRDESYKLKIEEVMHQKFPDSIELVGPAYGDAKIIALSESDVFVLPTSYKNECFPLSIIEGMCHSLAVVSTYEGAIPDMIDDNLNGRLFDINNIEDLTGIIAQYIDDAELLKRHKKSARYKFLQKYEISVFERNLCNILNDILTGKR